MENQIKLANELANECNGKFISTQRQLNNGTFAFDFGVKHKTYVFYKNGVVRCLTKRPDPYGRNFNITSCTPILWNNENGCKHIRHVSFEEALAYFRNRFSRKNSDIVVR